MTDIINSPGSVNQFFSPALSGVISTPLSIWISAATGNDANDGISASTPLATFAAFIARYGLSPIVSAPLTITFLDATVSEDISFFPIIQSSRVLITGTLTQTGSGTFTSAPTQRAKATNVYLEVTDTAQTWAPFVGAALLHDSTHDSYAWVAKDTGSNKARLTSLISASPSTSYWGAVTEVTSAASGDAYTLSTSTAFTGCVSITAGGAINANAGSGNLTFQNATFSGSARGCRFVAATNYLILLNCLIKTVFSVDGIEFVNCFFNTGASVSPASSAYIVNFLGGGSLVGLALARPSSLWFANGFLVQSHIINFQSTGVFGYITDLMVADWTTYAVEVTLGATVALNGAACFSGSSVTANSYAINVISGVVNNSSGTTWVLAAPIQGAARAGGTPTNFDFRLGAAGNIQGAPYNAGALAAEQIYTFAKLDAAVGSSGFGGGTTRLDGFASMAQG